MKWLGLDIDFVDAPTPRHFPMNADKLVNVRYLESLLHYKFNDPSLLVEALTHGSYMLPEIPRCYQCISSHLDQSVVCVLSSIGILLHGF
ncbi:Dicer-like protein 2 [Datura stramonium]|uniref:Dicer-like protein 2 n=1 Tax=Datura stramonium TaxID=4076 RepID=A0ABS8SCK3_DATST|nr:Dicer-like protein 2 [Datura stramonium]